MTKYTIYKAFDKKFPFKIWKIVVDANTRLVGVELRHEETTKPIIHVLDFEGNTVLDNLALDEKEWTLEAIRKETIILKRFGDMTPVKEGILFLDLSGVERCYIPDHILLDTYLDHIKLRHRSFQSGFEKYIDIATTKEISTPSLDYCCELKMPVPYTGTPPLYLKNANIQDLLWVSRSEDKLLWCYHIPSGKNFDLNLCIASASNILHEQCLMTNMPKMIPQPYFQIRNQIFIMSYNKQEIVSYLV